MIDLPPSIPDNVVKLWSASAFHGSPWYAELDSGNYAWVSQEGVLEWNGVPTPLGKTFGKPGFRNKPLEAEEDPIWTRLAVQVELNTQSCGCDLYYFMNNGCPSARGEPCVNGKFERY